MFNTALLYEIVAKGNPYDVIIGGSDLPADFDKGSVIITLINSETLTQSFKDFKTIHTQEIQEPLENNVENIEAQKQEGKNKKNIHTIQSISKIQNNYQFDLYRCNPQNLNYIDVELQAQKLREYLKSYDVMEYLETKGAQILPTISQINFLTDFNEQKKLINRAYFEVSIIFTLTSTQEVNIFDKIAIENKLIIGG